MKDDDGQRSIAKGHLVMINVRHARIQLFPEGKLITKGLPGG